MTYNSVCRAAPGKGCGAAKYKSADHNNIHLLDLTIPMKGGAMDNGLKVLKSTMKTHIHSVLGNILGYFSR